LVARGHEVVRLREPGGTPAGERIRHLLQHDEAGHNLFAEAEVLLFAASRAQLVREIIAPALARGAVVLSDRFLDSTTVYQGVARRLDPAEVAMLNRFAVGGVLPRRTFLLDVPVEVAHTRLQARGQADRFEREPAAFHEAVRQGYLELARAETERMQVLSGQRPPAEIHQQILHSLQQHYGLFA
jgi:dTMP kinase